MCLRDENGCPVRRGASYGVCEKRDRHLGVRRGPKATRGVRSGCPLQPGGRMQLRGASGRQSEPRAAEGGRNAAFTGVPAAPRSACAPAWRGPRGAGRGPPGISCGCDQFGLFAKQIPLYHHCEGWSPRLPQPRGAWTRRSLLVLVTALDINFPRSCQGLAENPREAESWPGQRLSLQPPARRLLQLLEKNPIRCAPRKVFVPESFQRTVFPTI